VRDRLGERDSQNSPRGGLSF